VTSNFVYKKVKNAKNLQNEVKRSQNIDKNTATRKKVWYELFAEFPNKTFATHNCEASAADDR